MSELPMLGGAYQQGKHIFVPHNCGQKGKIKLTVEQYEQHFFLALLEYQDERYRNGEFNG